MDAEVVENPRNNGLPTFGNGGTSELKIALSYLNYVFASSEGTRKRRITISGLAKELREGRGIAVEKDKLSELFEKAEKLGLVTITGKVSDGRDYRRYRLTP